MTGSMSWQSGSSDRRHAPLARTLRAALLLGWLGAWPAAHGETPEVFAVVGDTTITVQDFAMALREEGRRRYYHSQPPEAELRRFYRETADRLIERALVLKEAKRRGIRPDRRRVDTEMEQARQRAAHARGNAPDEVFWARLRGRIEEQQVFARLQAEVEGTSKPGEEALRRYHRTHPEKFTEPARVRAAVILLKVDPSAPPPSWQAARDEAATLVRRLRQGADFSEEARLRSGDPSSASRGGDMGYLHEGMLAKSVQEPLAKLAVGEISDPLTVLEGVAIFRLDERHPARPVEYAKARPRVQALWLQEEKQRIWSAFVAGLRASAQIRINEKYLEPESIPPRARPAANAG